jgi:YbgC/YbaW family acyl-CoA thioester hydrolase
MMQNTLRHRVEWGETDAAGIVFYPNYYRWFDRATHELFRAAGNEVDTILARGYAIPIVEAHANFPRPLRYDDVIDIESRVVEVRTRAFRIDHRIVCASEQVCLGYEVRAWVRLKAGGVLEAESIPDELRHLMT